MDNILASQNSTIRNILEKINLNCLGICFIVDEDKKLLGSITDGDLRRAMLQGKTVNDHITDIYNTSVIYFPVSTPNDIIIDSLTNKIKIIPLVDDRKRVVDYTSHKKVRTVPIATPVLGGNELLYVTDCIKTNWISSQGKYVTEFESQFRTYFNMPYALAVSNGTVALHLALLALGVEKDDEVIVPNFTFAATINAVLYIGAKPVIVDVDPDSWNISVAEIKAHITPKTKAIIPVHLYGQPCNMKEIMAIAKENELLVVEDCAESLGSKEDGVLLGSFGQAAAFSFFGNKTITTGEGGMVLFKEEQHYQKALMMRDHGMSKEKRYWHELVGFNYRMTNLQAALGTAQMERIVEILQKKVAIASIYIKKLAPIPGLQLPKQAANDFNTHWLFTLILPEHINREHMMLFLQENGIETRQVFYPLHVMPPYQEFAIGKTYPVTTDLSKRGLSLPSSVNLENETVERIADCIVDYMTKNKK